MIIAGIIVLAISCNFIDVITTAVLVIIVTLDVLEWLCAFELLISQNWRIRINLSIRIKQYALEDIHVVHDGGTISSYNTWMLQLLWFSFLF